MIARPAVAASLIALAALAAAPALVGPEPTRGAGGSFLESAIELARRDHPSIDADRVRGEVSRLAGLYRARVPAGAPAAEQADAFRAVLFDDERFEAVTELTSPETLRIDSVLRTKQGYCLSLSVLALCVAEAVGAPLHGVAAPNHFLVRYDDGTYRRNLEMTRQGREIPDAELPSFSAVSAGRRDSVYFRNLSAEEVLAIYLHNRGFAALAQGRRDDARADLTEAVRRLPSLPEAHRNLGVLLGEEGRWREARASFEKALALNPDDADSLLNRGLCRHALGDGKGAIEDLDVVLLLDPRRERARTLRAEWAKEAGRGPGSEAPRPFADPPAGAAPGLLATFFSGIDFEARVTSRVERDLDAEWASGSPLPGVPADRFSVRWQGFFLARDGGTYSFFVVANDGVRVFIDGELLLENWKEAGRDSWYGSRDARLDAGWHPIRVELFDERGPARLLCRIGQEGRERPLDLKDHLFHVPE